MSKFHDTDLDFITSSNLNGIKIYEVDTKSVGHHYSRKDFYKISLISGKYKFHYAHDTFETEGPILFFGNPHIPYSCEIINPSDEGYECLFTDEYIKQIIHSESFLQSPLFVVGGKPYLELNEEHHSFMFKVLRRMHLEQDSDYVFKDDLLRNYISLILHQTLRIEPHEAYTTGQNAAQRLTSRFLELLERQFPVESPKNPLNLKTPKDFANQLSVHVNHLNHSVNEVTGLSTSTHISKRIIVEAKALLQNTDWNIAEVGYSLGFQYPTYFNNFFKKMTNKIPKEYRVNVKAQA